MTISSQIANSAIQKFEHRGDVVPTTSMMRKLFTVGVMDNIDHNPSSTTVSDSFHGTDIYLIQHREMAGDGQKQSASLFNSKQECLGIPHLLEKFGTFLPRIAPPKEHLMIPESRGP
ncbi:hypothetical protein PoB_002786000 [Plakobranchus ocellatus]|uniref:Uncharacterized protein n=1 Tax=Plakobranchus ocellatus TaxID=259542 RepID=A0AAV4A1R1_9GAST|nr:hypothetical protein PoB_002786000 [Plakobranchus ocellatus]